MREHLRMARGVVSLYPSESGAIFLHRSFGLSEEEAARGVYRLGEGIVGKVAESGEAIVVPRVSTPALNMLSTYPRPGNVRELESVIERAMILAGGDVICACHLPPALQSRLPAGMPERDGLEARLAVIEYEMIVEALKQHHGNVTGAANQLGLTRRMLGLRMEKYKLAQKNFR